jgi:protein-disulfide isomerase
MRKLVRKILAVAITMAVSSSVFAAGGMNKLYQPAGNTIAGNPDGHITIVEFFDYNCGYCRLIYPSLNKMVEKNHDLRLVYREYPVLSPHSMLPAQAALAAQLQGKYMQLHTAMMEASMPLYEGEINKLAGEEGINTAQLDKDMNSDAVMNQLQTNLSVGQALNIQGVPSFIIVRTSPPSSHKAQVLVGPSISELTQAISEAEKSK